MSATLKKQGYGRENRLKYALAQELTNRALLTQVANRRKSATAAEDYLREVSENSPGSLEKQCIPTDPLLWKLENYEEFLQARRTLLSASLNQYLNGLATEAEADSGETTLEEMIAEGESELLEFKSSLRWDYRQGTVNKALEDVVAKTIAAFANSDGGTLLIGVDDDGNTLGLENDYASLGADKDKFELHLRGFLSACLGVDFVSSAVKVAFPVLEEQEICQIDVLASKHPIILPVTDKNGLKSEKAYVRNGNASQALSLSEYDRYRQERFD